MLSPTIWEDPSFNTLSYQARIAFIGLISNADDFGYLRGDYKSIKRLVFGFDENDNKEWYEKLLNYKNLHFYEVNGETYVHLAKWDTYQNQRDDRKQDSSYPPCPHCQAENDTSRTSDGQTRADDGQVPAEVKLSQVKLSKDKLVEETSHTPALENKDFFDQGETYHTIMAEFSRSISPPLVEREFKKFCLYWTEPNSTGKKVRWQQQSTFDVKRRLYTWFTRIKESQPRAISKGRGIA